MKHDPLTCPCGTPFAAHPGLIPTCRARGQARYALVKIVRACRSGKITVKEALALAEKGLLESVL
jgi:hypothetical protein